MKGGISMNKEEILAKSRKENQDERNLYIGRSANENAYLAVIIIFSTLSVILFVQDLLTGKAFADYKVFMLALLIGASGQTGTLYYYDRDTKVFLISTILEIIGAIICLASIISTGMGWF